MAKRQIKRKVGSEANDWSGRAKSAMDGLGDKAAANPLLALGGGLALGAVIAAVLPQSEQESDLLEPAGTRIADAGRSAVDRVREISKAKVDELAGDRLRDLLGVGKDPASA